MDTKKLLFWMTTAWVVAFLSRPFTSRPPTHFDAIVEPERAR
jgi:hypothetical protein